MRPSTWPLHRGRYRTAAVVTAALVLAGCSNGPDGGNSAQGPSSSAAPTQETVTVTSTVEPTGASVTGSPTRQTPTVTTTPCDPATVPVAADAAGIPQPFPDRGWAVSQTGNLCGTLGYAELVTAGGTGSSPTQLMLYNEGEFLGTGIRCNAVGEVVGSTYDSVSVQYRWPVGDDSNANMSGRADIVFRWNRSSVDMIGELPPAAVGSPC